MSIAKPVYFISDLHLGRHRDELENLKKELLLKLFQRIQDEDADLIINGDLFDFWFDYRTVIPKRCYWVCYALNKLIEAGTNIQMIPGNHDYWMFSFFQEEMGISVHHKPLSAVIHNQRIFIAHGDGLAAKDHLYRVAKRIFRHPLSIWLYRWLHPDFGIWFADKFSHRGRKTHDAKNPRITAEEYAKAANLYLKQGYDIVIFGHTHKPELIHFKEGTYLNVGNWIESFSYGLLDQGEVELLYCPGDS